MALPFIGISDSHPRLGGLFGIQWEQELSGLSSSGYPPKQPASPAFDPLLPSVLTSQQIPAREAVQSLQGAAEIENGILQ
jgi:hypothetical protein